MASAARVASLHVEVLRFSAVASCSWPLLVMFSRSCWHPNCGSRGIILELAAEAQASAFGKQFLGCKRGSNSLGIQLLQCGSQSHFRKLNLFLQLFQQFCKPFNAL